MVARVYSLNCVIIKNYILCPPNSAMKNKLERLEKLIFSLITKRLNIILILYTVLIAYLSTIPGIVIEDSLENAIYLWVPPNLQSFGHVLAYAGLVILWYLFFISTNLTEKNSVILSLLTTVAFGVFFELVQQYIPGRDAVISDAILNSIGAILGLWYFDNRALKRLFYINY